MITLNQLEKILPTNNDISKWLTPLNTILPKYEINTDLRIACFLAQTGHESADYKRLSENLNYSAQGLANTWPKRYAIPNTKKPNALALRIERNPEEIANHTYCDRNGNGPYESGDGWKYRGRGLIQLTFKSNYEAFAHSINKSLDEIIVYIETPAGAIESACWFWKSNNLNVLADKADMELITKRINGGTIGLEDRLARFFVALSTLKGV